MRYILFIVTICCVVFLACSSAKKPKSSIPTQGITGRVTEASGNQMPMKGAPPANYKGILTTVCVYEPTNTRQVTQQGTAPLYTGISTKRVASATTDSLGNFTIDLPAGTYSVFVKLGEQYFANLFDTHNNISLVTVENGKLTKMDIVVNARAAY